MERFIAHAGEVHSTTNEAASHTLNDWYIALPLFILVVFGFGAIVQLTFKKSFITLTAVNILFLIVGFSTYNFSALISVLSITLGLAGTLLLTLTSLGSPKVATEAIVSRKKTNGA